MKHLLIFGGAFFVIVFFAIASIGIFSDSKDLWICQDGLWVKHGNPKISPSGKCLSVAEQIGLRNPTPAEFEAPKSDLEKGNTGDVSSEIKIEAPLANEIVTSPLKVSGQAKGNWFFEGSFPIKLIGEDGLVIAKGIATAGSDWMTTDFVPFTAELNFDPASSTIGMLVLANDNPSGMPEKDKQYGIPVRFNSIEKIPLKIYFGNTDLNKNVADCSLVFPVERMVIKTKSAAKAVLEELLSGTLPAEKKEGYFSSINTGVALNKITIINGVAKVDFSQEIQNAVGGSCRVAAIRAQIEQTLLQFPTVKQVIISVNGNTDEALQP